MKLAIINDEIDQDLARAADAVVECGLTGVEIRSVANVPPHVLSDAQLGDVRRTLTERNLAVAGFCPPALKRKMPRTDADVAATRNLLGRAIEQANILGSPHVRIFTFYRDGDPDPKAAALVAAEVLDGLDLAGVRLLVETGTRTNTPTMALTLAFLEALGRPEIGVLWDPGNSVFSGWHANPFPEEYTIGREVIGHIHVKDPAGTSGYVRLGDGDLPWGRIIERLGADDYTGWLSLETHWRSGRVLTQDQRDRPWGDAFSEGGYPASVTCMRALRALVAS
ncbi:sugar phosphate isomerase/epimerase family protein [Streptosporangium sp. NPDC049644]|uniref:sugar phosphate isomerase/epimerase family protein n=1 Tax=Streptosporangium sp. NPDC049644 TaxID=3155507 RepID=UPI0034255EA7